MATSNIQARLTSILATEEAPIVDWPVVDRLCDELDRDLEASSDNILKIVAHFLSDSDIRARDASYGETQRNAIRTYLATGDYFPRTAAIATTMANASNGPKMVRDDLFRRSISRA